MMMRMRMINAEDEVDNDKVEDDYKEKGDDEVEEDTWQ